MGNNIANLQRMEAEALKNDGRIDAQEAKNLAKAATTKEEKAVVRGMLANDNFGAPTKPKEKQELSKMLGGSLPRSNALAGKEIPGMKGAVIQRVLGDAGGYESKHHAIAVARAAGMDNAMVVKDKNGRWQAVESSLSATGAKGSNGAIKDVLHVGKLDQNTFDTLKKKALGAKGFDAQRAAWKEFASYTLGVPPNEIQVNFKGEQSSVGKVNISLDPAFAPEGQVSGFNHDTPEKPELLELGPKSFDRPANGWATLAHEETHAQHYRDTRNLYREYKDSKSKETFRSWAAGHMKGGGSNFKEVMKVDLIAGYEDGAGAATELFARIEAARVAFRSGDLTQAKTDLLKVGTMDALPLPQTQSLAQDELRALRDSLPDGAREVFDDMVRDAKRGVLKGL